MTEEEGGGEVHEHPHRHRGKRPPGPGELLDRVLPEETRDHLMNAREEWLLALRSLIDERLDRLEEKRKSSEGSREIEIE